jgi:hypothetical protein
LLMEEWHKSKQYPLYPADLLCHILLVIIYS